MVLSSLTAPPQRSTAPCQRFSAREKRYMDTRLYHKDKKEDFRFMEHLLKHSDKVL